ncbi:hypothetical protein ACHAWF_012857 [Thalassiosira exigua]
MVAPVLWVAAFCAAFSNAQEVNPTGTFLRGNTTKSSLINPSTGQHGPFLGGEVTDASLIDASTEQIFAFLTLTWIVEQLVSALVQSAESYGMEQLYGSLFGSDSSQPIDIQVSEQLNAIQDSLHEIKGELDDLWAKEGLADFRSEWTNLNIPLDLIEAHGIELAEFVEKHGGNTSLPEDVTIGGRSPEHFQTKLFEQVHQACNTLKRESTSPIPPYIEWQKSVYPATGLRAGGRRQDLVKLVNQISASLANALMTQTLFEKQFPEFRESGVRIFDEVKTSIYYMWSYIGAAYPALDGHPNHFFFKSIDGGDFSKYAFIDETRAGWNIPLNEVRHETMVKLSGQDVDKFLQWTFFDRPRANADLSVQQYLQHEGLTTTDHLYSENFHEDIIRVAWWAPKRRAFYHEELKLDFTSGNGALGRERIKDSECVEVGDEYLPAYWDCPEGRNAIYDLRTEQNEKNTHPEEYGFYLPVLDMTDFYNTKTGLPGLTDVESIREERDGIIVNARRELSDTAKIELLISPGPLLQKKYHFRLVYEDGTPGSPVDSTYIRQQHTDGLTNFHKDQVLIIQAGHYLMAPIWGFIVKQSTTIIDTANVAHVIINEGDCFVDSDCEKGKMPKTGTCRTMLGTGNTLTINATKRARIKATPILHCKPTDNVVAATLMESGEKGTVPTVAQGMALILDIGAVASIASKRIMR